MSWTNEEKRYLRHEIFWKKGLCGCGSGTSYQVLFELLERADSDNDARLGFYKPFEDASARWAEFGGHALDAMGLTSHGGSIGWAWLTDEGKLLLRFLREFGTDDNKWPEWAHGESVDGEELE